MYGITYILQPEHLAVNLQMSIITYFQYMVLPPIIACPGSKVNYIVSNIPSCFKVPRIMHPRTISCPGIAIYL